MNDELRQQLHFINTLEGWCSTAKAEAIAQLVIDHKPRTVVELGVFGARSLIAFGMGLRSVGHDGVVWGIDPWTKEAALEGEYGTANGSWWASLDMDAIRDGALKAVGAAGLWHWTRVIVAKGEECASMFSELDMLHIDGNHAEQKALADATLWYHRVRTGGIILFDDIDWPTTAKAVSYLSERCNTLFDVGTCRVFQKK